MDEADKLCNRIAIVDHGKIVTLDTSEKLKNKIGGEVITIETSEPEKFSSVLKNYKWCKSVKVHEGSVTLGVEDAGKKVSDIVKISEKNNLHIGSLMIKRPSLEGSVFTFYGKNN